MLRLLSSVNHSQPGHLSDLSAHPQHPLPVLTLHRNKCRNNWWQHKAVPAANHLSQTKTPSCSRVQTKGPWEWLLQHHRVAGFTACAQVRICACTDQNPFTCFGCVLLVEGGCSILRSCSCARVACSVVSMPSTFCHTCVTISKKEASLFSSQLW